MNYQGIDKCITTDRERICITNHAWHASNDVTIYMRILYMSQSIQYLTL